MLKKYFILIFLLFAAFCELSSEKTQSPVVRGTIDLAALESIGEIIPLNGVWGFHWNRLISSGNIQPADWINVPGNWASGKKYPVSGFATYSLMLEGLIPGMVYQLYVPESISAYRLFLDGQEISSNGTVGKSRETSRPSFLPKTVLFTAMKESETLHLQVSNYHYRKSGIWRDILIGKPVDITAFRQKKMIMETFLIGLMAFVTIYHLSLYLFRREEKPELFFGLVCLIFLLRLLTTGEQLITYLFNNFSWEAARRIEFLPFSLVSIFMGLYFNSLYPVEFNRRFLKWYLTGASFFTIILLFFPVRISNHFIPAGELYLFSGIVYSIAITVKALKQKRNGAVLILISMGILLLSAINDILYSNQIITSVYIVPLGFIVFIITQSLMLSRRFSISFRTIENLTLSLKDFNKSLSRFVPFQFLEYLNKNSILEVELGDQALKDMTILFADIRSFTTLSEVMSPEENFRFLNSFLSQVVPVIREGGGFVDKFIGDGIMALFPESTDKGLETAINLQNAVHKYNEARSRAGYKDIKLGIGMHTGGLMLGTIGETDRMETTVISDTVNIASRMEMLTKHFGASIIISMDMYNSLKNPEMFNTRNLGSTKVKGKRKPIVLKEILDGLPQNEKDKKTETKEIFEKGVEYFESCHLTEARKCFHQVLNIYPADTASSLFISKCTDLEYLDEEKI